MNDNKGRGGAFRAEPPEPSRAEWSPSKPNRPLLGPAQRMSHERPYVAAVMSPPADGLNCRPSGRAAIMMRRPAELRPHDRQPDNNYSARVSTNCRLLPRPAGRPPSWLADGGGSERADWQTLVALSLLPTLTLALTLAQAARSARPAASRAAPNSITERRPSFGPDN